MIIFRLKFPLPSGLSEWAQWRQTLTFMPLPSNISLESAKIWQTSDLSRHKGSFSREEERGRWERRWFK